MNAYMENNIHDMTVCTLTDVGVSFTKLSSVVNFAMSDWNSSNVYNYLSV